MTQIPLFQPPSEWTPPEKFPDLSDDKEIAIDLETHDPNIKETGPGWAVGNGYIAGNFHISAFALTPHSLAASYSNASDFVSLR